MTDIHNKFRPQRFQDVLGQDMVVQSICAALQKGSGHSFVLSGPSGVGKTTLARLIAVAVGCSKHNIVEVDAASHSGVEAMRDIVGVQSVNTIGGSPCRMVIIDEAHALSKQAWQALLKAVEEPGKHNYWAFCTTEGGKIPQTIRTRCLCYDLKPLRATDLLALAEYVAQAEGMQVTKEVLNFLCANVDGSPRRLLTVLAKCANCHTVEYAKTLLDVVETEEGGTAFEIAKAVFSGGVPWPHLMQLVDTCVSLEGARLTILAYGVKVAVNARSEAAAEQACRTLACFTCVPFSSTPAEAKAQMLACLYRSMWGSV